MVTYAHCIILLYYELLSHYYYINKEAVFFFKKRVDSLTLQISLRGRCPHGLICFAGILDLNYIT